MKKIIIAAGGTGGHINAALSLKEVFKNDYEVEFISGQRHLDYQLFKDHKVRHLGGRPLRSNNPFTLLKNLLRNIIVFIYLFYLYLIQRPKFVIGTGGYICGPALLVAKILFLKVFIVEQNAAAGLTNRILAKFSDLVFVSFKNTKGIEFSSKVILSGNPIRSSIRFKNTNIGEKINILIFGGSLGAKQLNEAAQRLTDNPKFSITHQVGKNNITDFQSNNYKQVEYIDDMQEAYNWSNIIISRSGASSISELEIVRRPSILVPYQYATDDHQTLNAKSLKEKELFYVEIINPKASDQKIADHIYKAILGIVEREDFDPHSSSETSVASELIKKKVYEFIK